MSPGRRWAEDVASFKGMGLAIKKLRDRRDMSQADLAKGAELSESALSRIESGDVEATWGTLRRIAYTLEIPLEAMIEIAEELAPGIGGGWWRRRTREQRREFGRLGEC